MATEQLKTLKDIQEQIIRTQKPAPLDKSYSDGYTTGFAVGLLSLKEELRQEAIKWVKAIEKSMIIKLRMEDYADLEKGKPRECLLHFIKGFLNITDEELK